MNSVMMSSKDMTWETPHDFFAELDREFHFTLDVAAGHTTAKCDKYYTEETNGLDKDWSGEVVWMNPPYGREIKHWIKKAYSESRKKDGAKVVALIPYRPDTRYWFDYIWQPINDGHLVNSIVYATVPRPGVQVRAIKGRLKFLDAGQEKCGAAFPSAVIIFG